MSFELNPVTREFFTIFYGQAVSPNQDFLALGNNLGQLFAVPIYQKDDKSGAPKKIYKSESNIFSMVSIQRPNSNILLTGSQNGSIAAFNWSHLTSKDDSDTIQPLWITSTNVREANSMCLVNDETQFAVGYGDGIVEIQDCEKPGKVIVEFCGHEEQINQVVQFAPNQVVSCSTDGTVNLYDALAGSDPVKTLNILSHDSVIRPGHSRAVLALGVQDQFVICGGGVDLAKYDISSGSLLQNFSPPKTGNDHYNIHSIEVSRDKIGVGISDGSVLGYSHSGHFVNEIPLGTGPILNLSSLSHDSHRHLLTAASGVSSKVSMIVNYGYVSYSIGTLF